MVNITASDINHDTETENNHDHTYHELVERGDVLADAPKKAV